jgi:PKD repeat protein
MRQILRILLLAAFILNFPPVAVAQSQNGTDHRSFPQLNLPATSRGEEAIGRLGGRLPEVARWYGMTIDQFTSILRQDRSAWIDQRGRLFYIDATPEQGDTGEADALPSAAPFSESQTFLLNSRPGSDRVIYLDFDGHTISGRVWNGGGTLESPAYDRDGDASSFSSLEIEYIQQMWLQVAEDFAPFDVNVTTQDPGQSAITRSDSEDQVYGTRVVITRDNFINCGCGGYAYLRTFDDVGDYYKPAFVFNTSLRGAGEAISHEAGHNLGLSHDGNASTSYYRGHGSDDTGWAPIMGSGYYQKLVQWSQGEYLGANQGQDDIQLIQNNGAPLAADDHGDTNSSASSLVTMGDGISATISGYGMIRHRDDVDVFRIIGGTGNYSIDVSPADSSPNLDILAQLTDGQGNLVASSNPLSSLATNITATDLPAGEYFLTIDGAGEGDPLVTGYTDYASLGHYTISGTLPDAGGQGAPVASVSAAPLSGKTPLTVYFDGSGSSDPDGSITEYNWDFGDGNYAVGSVVSNVYYAPGSYTASLQVTDDSNLANTASAVVTVDNQAPYAVASADTASGAAPETVNFQGSASSDPDAPYGYVDSWHWDFGDGSSSSQPDPNHTYTSSGDFIPTLTVTDDQGSTHTVLLNSISISPQPYADFHAHDEIAGAGSVNGIIENTYFDDGITQSVLEEESGGKKRTRYSFLEHSWLFTIPRGDVITLHLNAWSSSSSDGDNISVAWSLDGGNNFQEITTLESTYDDGIRDFILPSDMHGEVRIRLQDTDRTPGNQTLDRFYVDEMYIRSENSQGNIPPTVPVNLSVTIDSSNALTLNWTDSASSEYGYVVARSVNGGPWKDQYQTLGENADNFTDTGLSSGITYIYRVAAYNGAGNSAWSEQASATTADIAGGPLSLSVTGYKLRGVHHADLAWSGGNTAKVDIYRDQQLVITVPNSGSYTNNTGAKGGASYSYDVCEHATTTCSNAVTLMF